MCDSDDEYWLEEELAEEQEAYEEWLASWTPEQKAEYEARCALYEKWKDEHAYVTSRVRWFEDVGRIMKWGWEENRKILRDCVAMWPGLLEAFPDLAKRVAAILSA